MRGAHCDVSLHACLGKGYLDELDPEAGMNDYIPWAAVIGLTIVGLGVWVFVSAVRHFDELDKPWRDERHDDIY